MCVVLERTDDVSQQWLIQHSTGGGRWTCSNGTKVRAGTEQRHIHCIQLNSDSGVIQDVE